MAVHKRLLHVGCGYRPSVLPKAFSDEPWHEVRLDIDSECDPDIVASISDMSCIELCSFDAVYSSYNLNHVYLHEALSALREFSRVLVPTGVAVIRVPDMQMIAELIIAGKIAEPIAMTASGPVTPLDVIYGLSRALAAGCQFLAHKVGFTDRLLGDMIVQNGFEQAAVHRDPGFLALWAVAHKTKPEKEIASEELTPYCPGHVTEVRNNTTEIERIREECDRIKEDNRTLLRLLELHAGNNARLMTEQAEMLAHTKAVLSELAGRQINDARQ